MAKKQYTTPLHIYAIALFVIWTLIIIGEVKWKIDDNRETTYELAESQARANFNKDKAFRLWLTGHGRIYVPIGERYQPDDYLAHIKDRDVTTESGIKLSMINPARIVRELDQQYKQFYGVAGRVTSLAPLREENAPDDWERNALLKLEQGVKEVFEYTTVQGEPYLRLIQPLPIAKGCLLCHVDLAQKENGVGGGVTIALPMNKLLARMEKENSKDIKLILSIWLVGTVGLAIAFFYLKRQTGEKQAVIMSLATSESRNKAITESALDSIITIDSRGVVTEVNPATESTFGYQRREMIGRDLAELIIPEEMREQHRAGLLRVVDTDESTILNNRIETIAQHADGHRMPIELAVTQIVDERKDVFFTAYLRDLTEANELKEKLTYQAGHDALTGLMNRHAFEEHAKRILSEIDSQSYHCLLFLDLDQFKIVNDSSGHIAGDELLRQLGHVLQRRKRSSDALARLGGDEFALLLEGCQLEKAKEIANALVDEIRQYRFYWEEKVYSVGVSIGLIPIRGRSITYSKLLSDADAACYKAKKDGRNRYYVFEQDDEELVKRRDEMTWVPRIQEALQADKFILYHQMIHHYEC